MAVGCIQAQKCHTNACPVGVATQDPLRYHALNVNNKAERVHQFHTNTMEALSELVAAMGLDSPDELGPHYICKRIEPNKVLTYDEAYRFVSKGALLDGSCDDPLLNKSWAMASANSFQVLCST